MAWTALHPELETRTRLLRLWHVPVLRSLTPCRLRGLLPVIWVHRDFRGSTNLSPLAPWHSTYECLLGALGPLNSWWTYVVLLWREWFVGCCCVNVVGDGRVCLCVIVLAYLFVIATVICLLYIFMLLHSLLLVTRGWW